MSPSAERALLVRERRRTHFAFIHRFTAVASAFAQAPAYAEATARRSADKSCEGG